MFKLINEDEKSFARVGKLKTAHGTVKTPFFMPVATKGSAKLISQGQLKELGTTAIIANSYLLYLKPGVDLVEEVGGMHKFMNWDNCIFTDSGGFQILSPEFLIKGTSKGVLFKSPFDGQEHLISPEKAMEIQNKLGSDVAMVLDDVPHYGLKYDIYAKSVKRTRDWAKKCKAAHNNDKQLVFGIAQGGTHKDLRARSIADLKELDFDGLALGGLCIGEPKKLMLETVQFSAPLLPKEKPHYLMGVGSPDDLLECINLGIDAFDSCFPTRMARHGVAFTSKGTTNLVKSVHAKNLGPLDNDCDCFVCKNHSRAYLHHLFKVKEFNSSMLLSYHNTYFIQKLMAKTIKAIEKNEFQEFKQDFIAKYHREQ